MAWSVVVTLIAFIHWLCWDEGYAPSTDEEVLKSVMRLWLMRVCSVCRYVHAAKLAEDVADLLAPQSGAYYDIWLDGEKFVSAQMEVGPDPCTY